MARLPKSTPDDVPPTPRNSSSHDTERDLEPPAREPSARRSAADPLDASTTMGESTLLSVKAAADRVSEQPDHRVEELERRLSQLEARLKVLELRGGLGLTDKRWLFWVGLLLALILGWQLRAYFR